MIAPYYDSGGITIYHGDCRDFCEDRQSPVVDLVIADPPFFLPARISTSRKAWPRSLSEVAIMDHYFKETFWWLRYRHRITGALYTFCDSTSYAVFLSNLYPLYDRTQCIVWDKGRGGLGSGWRHSVELIIHGALGSTVYADGFRRNLITVPVVDSDSRSHASEKPVDILGTLLSAHPVGVVLDPYMGTGATLVAARKKGWRAIGVELEERYCEIAARRLSQGVLDFGEVA